MVMKRGTKQRNQLRSQDGPVSRASQTHVGTTGDLPSESQAQLKIPAGEASEHGRYDGGGGREAVEGGSDTSVSSGRVRVTSASS